MYFLPVDSTIQSFFYKGSKEKSYDTKLKCERLRYTKFIYFFNIEFIDFYH